MGSNNVWRYFVQKLPSFHHKAHQYFNPLIVVALDLSSQGSSTEFYSEHSDNGLQSSESQGSACPNIDCVSLDLA